MCLPALVLGGFASVFERFFVVEDLLSLRDSLSEEDSGFERVLPNAGLMRQDEAVAAIEDGHAHILRVLSRLVDVLTDHRLHDLAL
jgi:hypothetical protein